MLAINDKGCNIVSHHLVESVPVYGFIGARKYLCKLCLSVQYTLYEEHNMVCHIAVLTRNCIVPRITYIF